VCYCFCILCPLFKKNVIKYSFVYIRALGVENIKRTCKHVIFNALNPHLYFNLYLTFLPFFPTLFLSVSLSLSLSLSVSISLSTPDMLSLHPAAATETSTRENIDCWVAAIIYSYLIIYLWSKNYICVTTSFAVFASYNDSLGYGRRITNQCLLSNEGNWSTTRKINISSWFILNLLHHVVDEHVLKE